MSFGFRQGTKHTVNIDRRQNALQNAQNRTLKFKKCSGIINPDLCTFGKWTIVQKFNQLELK